MTLTIFNNCLLLLSDGRDLLAILCHFNLSFLNDSLVEILHLIQIKVKLNLRINQFLQLLGLLGPSLSWLFDDLIASAFKLTHMLHQSVLLSVTVLGDGVNWINNLANVESVHILNIVDQLVPGFRRHAIESWLQISVEHVVDRANMSWGVRHRLEWDLLWFLGQNTQ